MTSEKDLQELPDFEIEFQGDVPHFDIEMQDEAERRLRKLSQGHTDIIGAAIAVTRPAKTESAFIYQARVMVYTRPNNIVATEKDDTLEGALKGALSAVERQVREKRDKLGEPWKRPDIPGTST